MDIISNCSTLEITSELLPLWYNNEESADIHITHDICNSYNIDLPIRYGVVGNITSCTSDPLTTVTIEFTTNLVNLFTDIDTTLTTNIINDTTIQFIDDSPISDAITITVTQFGYEYVITFVLSEIGVEVDPCDNTRMNFTNSFQVTQPNIEDLLCVQYDEITNVLTIPNSALISDCSNTEDIPYGFYTVDINNQDSGCIYVDCDELLKCKVGQHMIDCPDTNLPFLWYTFSNLLFTPVGMNLDCINCTDIGTLYQEILNIVQCDCKPTNDCGC